MKEFSINIEAIQSINAETAWHYRIIPFEHSDFSMKCYIENLENSVALIDELVILTGKKIEFKYLNSDEIQMLLAKYYRKSEAAKTSKIIEKNDDFLEGLIAEAKELGSSDIHIEAYENNCRVRVRIDGMMVERYKIEKKDYPSMVNKIKILSNLDIAEKRLPQDGRIFFKTSQHKFDIRVSILPTLHGEKIVMRILSNDATNIDIHKLGFSSFDLENYLEGLKNPKGILLISGPTGSGKTTTLYATLKLLNQEHRNILTIEDPIEYTLEGINQVQLKESIGLTFGAALRTFLRQDPDIIMLGEIRDLDTANMAIRASLTGHLVLSTIHTNSAWGTVARLSDMGVPSYLTANTLNTSVAQRLLRLLCTNCKLKEAFEPKFYPKNFRPKNTPTHHYRPIGCEKCHYTGFKGRKAVYEVIPIDYELANEIKKANNDIYLHLKERNIRTLSENAHDIFLDGMTSIEEIYPLLLN